MGVSPPGQSPARSSRARKPFQPIGRSIVSATIVGVLAAGGYGLITGSYIAVIGVWSVAGPIIGALVTYYFGPQRDTG